MLKIRGITPLRGGYQQLDFVWEDEKTRILLEETGFFLLQGQRFPILFFNALSGIGQLLLSMPFCELVVSQAEQVEIDGTVLAEPQCKPILVASGDQIAAPMRMGRRWQHRSPLVLLGVKKEFPFAIKPSLHWVSQLPPTVTATSVLLEDWGVVCRLSSLIELPGCFEGQVNDLLALYQENAKMDFCIYDFGG